MDCKHENKKMIDWSITTGFLGSGIHISVYKCKDCGKRINEIDAPKVYNYPPKFEEFNGRILNTQDIEIILEKEKMIK